MFRNLLLVSLTALLAQERPAFEVASIKPRQFSPGLMGVDYQAGGRMVATQAPLQLLIMSAYNILPAQLQEKTGMANEGKPQFPVGDKSRFVSFSCTGGDCRVPDQTAELTSALA